MRRRPPLRPRPRPRRAWRRARPGRRQRRRPSRRVPANGAVSDSSIFIASITPSTCPSSTRSPSATRTSSTVPGIGATTRAVADGLGVGEPVRPGEDDVADRGRTTSTTSGCTLTTARTRVAVDHSSSDVVLRAAPAAPVRRPPCRHGGRRRRRGRARRSSGPGRHRAGSRRSGKGGRSSARGQHRRDPGRHHPRHVVVGRAARRGGRARRCRWWRRGTRRSPRAPAGSRRWWSARGSPCRRGRATSACRAVSRSGPWAMTLPSIGSYDVLTTWPLSSAWSTRMPSALGHRTRLVVPACGRKPPKESSAYTRASMACPSMRQVVLARPTARSRLRRRGAAARPGRAR